MRSGGRVFFMWVKICGITRHEDAILACELGADAVGFVFTGSPRRVSKDTVAPWIQSIAGIEKVGVFTNESTEEIMRVCDELGLDTIQLHAGVCRTHESLWMHYNIIYAMDVYRVRNLPEGIPWRILIDSSKGSGIKGAWKELTIPYILAGGLTPENVRDAILIAKPAGVDVASGVERAPGIKDRALMERFIREAKS
jgi:phosphoribosylanthranilate isomerase